MKADNIKADSIAKNSQRTSWLTGIIAALEKVNPVSRWLLYISGIMLFVYTCLIFLDVVLRYVFDHPLSFSADIGSVMLPVFLFLGAAFVQVEKGHIAIDIITSQLSRKKNLVLSTALYILCLATTGVIIWRSSLAVISFIHHGSKYTSGIPFFPSALVIPIGCLFLFIVFFKDILNYIRELKELHAGAVSWFLAIGVPIVLLILIALGMQGLYSGLSKEAIGIISIVLLFVLLFLGMPLAIAFIMLAVALSGFSSSPAAGFMLAGQTLFSQVSDYTWTVIALYTYMSYVFMASGIGDSAYFAVNKWVGHYRGGLAIATIIACVALAAINGSPLPAIIVMGTMGLPEMRKYGYSDKLSTGSILAGATLGPIIPPSLPFIVYGLIMHESIGKLFIAGIIPGLMLALSFIIVIVIVCRINPNLGPGAEKASWHDRLISLPKVVPMLVLFLLVLGGIYLGVFTAMEGGGIGAFGALIIALVTRTLSWQKFKTSMIESAKTNAILFFIIVGGLIFGTALGTSGLGGKLVEAINQSSLTPFAFVTIILVVYFIFGLICDAPIILLLTLPIIAPTIKSLGIDLIWFGVLSTIVVNLGVITPPFATGIFMLKNMGPKDLKLSSIYAGVIPFCIASLVVTIIIMLIPSLATWLPALMSK